MFEKSYKRNGMVLVIPEKQTSSPSNPTQPDDDSKQMDVSSLKINEDFNTSLVFGNDQVHVDLTEPDQEVSFENDNIFAAPLKKNDVNGNNISLKYVRDTQVIQQQRPKYQETKIPLLGDTQVIESPSSSDERARYNLLSPNENSDMRIFVLDGSRIAPSESHTRHRIQDTQIINNDNTQIIGNYNTQIITDQTQVINKPTQVISTQQSFQSTQIQTNKDITIQSPKKQVTNSSPQVHLHNEFTSHRQVLNTQEQADISRNQESNDTIEVQSDDEQDKPEDNISTYKIKRRIPQPGDRKRMKRSETTIGITDIKSPINLRMNSVPVILESTNNLVSQPSPPVQLVRRTSSPTKEEHLGNTTIVDEEVEDTTIPDEERSITHPPSSPEFNIPFDETSESEDIEEIEEPIPGKRRIDNIIDSQPTIDETIEEIDNANILRTETSNVLTQDDIINHNSVWATYNNLKIYSGIVVTKDFEYSNVDFRDGIYRIKNTDLKLLDIRIGDTLNIRNSPHKYIVTGLGSGDSPSLVQCIRGYNIVYLCRYPPRPKAEELKVPLADCFMEVDDWAQHESNYRLTIESQDLLSDTLPLTPTKTNRFTPFISQVSTKSSLKYSLHELTSLFSGRLFCITGIVGNRKEQIKQMIEKNGGILIDRELNEIFEYKTVDDSLVLQSDYIAGLSFAALISNNYCRSAKYLQALALGWPILSDVYIDDCIRDKSMVESWPGYLLPSGQSKRLNAITSQNVYKFRKNYEADILLDGQLGLNNDLLHEVDIIVSTDNINSNSLETSKLIFYSFGAKSLQYCTKSNQATKIIKSLGNEVIVYEDGKAIEKLLSTMTSRSTRRQKESKKVRVVNWEWLVQCVIGGIIWESPTYMVNI